MPAPSHCREECTCVCLKEFVKFKVRSAQVWRSSFILDPPCSFHTTSLVKDPLTSFDVVNGIKGCGERDERMWHKGCAKEDVHRGCAQRMCTEDVVKGMDMENGCVGNRLARDDARMIVSRIMQG